MNENDNIELPKRIDELPNNPNIQPTTNETVVNDNVPIDKIETNLFPSNEIKDNMPPSAAELVDIVPQNLSPEQNIPEVNQNVNIFDNNPEPNIPDILEPVMPTSSQAEMPINKDSQDTEILTMVTPELPATPEEIEKPETPITPEEVQEPVVPPTNNIPPTPAEPLNKKVLVEDPVAKDKGNALVGFFALLLILAIILLAFYYFIKLDYIKIPDELRNKIPFLTTTTTAPVNNQEEENEDENNLPEITIVGMYSEETYSVCPDIGSKLILEENLTFIYSKLDFDEVNDVCNVAEIIGTYTENESSIQLVPTENPEQILVAEYITTDNLIEIIIEDNSSSSIHLYKINEDN